MAHFPFGDPNPFKAPTFPSPFQNFEGDRGRLEAEEEVADGTVYPIEDSGWKLRILCEIARTEFGTGDCEVSERKLEELIAKHANLKRKFSWLNKQTDRVMKVISDLYIRGKVLESGPVQVISVQRLNVLKRLEEDYTRLDVDYEDLLAERDEWEAKAVLLGEKEGMLEEENTLLEQQLEIQKALQSKKSPMRNETEKLEQNFTAPFKKRRVEVDPPNP